MEVKAGIDREREQMGQPSGRRRKGRERWREAEKERDPWEIYMRRNKNIRLACVYVRVRCLH